MTKRLEIFERISGGLCGVVCLGAMTLASLPAHAFVVTYNGGAVSTSTSCATSNDNDENAVEPLVESAPCGNGNLTLLYKVDAGAAANGGTESGPFADDYGAFGWNPAGDPGAVEIRWDGPNDIDCPTCILAVKDGSQVPAIYAINIGAWDGTSSIFLSGFWPDQGAISNVSIWGSDDTVDPPIETPEPASLALVGLALAAAGVANRRRKMGRQC